MGYGVGCESRLYNGLFVEMVRDMLNQTRWLLISVTVFVSGALLIPALAWGFPRHQEVIMFTGLLLFPLCNLFVIYKGRLLYKTHRWYLGVRILSAWLVLGFLAVATMLIALYVSNN